MQNYHRESGCVFCIQVAEPPEDPGNLVVFRGQRAFVILNKYPYNSGHLMVVPYDHRPTLEELDRETRGEIMELANLATQALQRVYQPQGFNLGVNVGAAAGAGIMDHIHMHVLPRWGGDTNFISTLGGTRVLPEALEETCRRVKEAFKELT
jgi:ATP adenylyltransferase